MSDCPASFSDFHRAARLVPRAARAADGRLGLLASRRRLPFLLASLGTAPAIFLACFPARHLALTPSFASAPRRLSLAFSEVIYRLCAVAVLAKSEVSCAGASTSRLNARARRAVGYSSSSSIATGASAAGRRHERTGILLADDPGLMRVSAAAPTTWWESRDARDAERGRRGRPDLR